MFFCKKECKVNEKRAIGWQFRSRDDQIIEFTLETGAANREVYDVLTSLLRKHTEQMKPISLSRDKY